MRFVKLTENRTNKPVYVCTEYIGLVKPGKAENGAITIIELVGLGTTIIKVKENVEEVMALIKG